MKNDTPKLASGDKKGDNVIDMTSRIREPDYRERLKGMKVRFDMEHAKVAVSTSLLSIVILVTLANNNLLTSKLSDTDPNMPVASSQDFERVVNKGGRGIASVPSTTSPDQFVAENPEFARSLARRDLSATASVGHPPTQLDRLQIEYSSYSISLLNGKLKEIRLPEAVNEAKRIDNTAVFLESQRDLLPEFERPLRISQGKEGVETVEMYQLVNRFSMPVAKVQFRLNESGGLLAMRVSAQQLASK